MKDEINIDTCRAIKELKVEIDDYMGYYNNGRYQWGLAKLAPRQYYTYVTTGYHPLADIINIEENPE